MYLQLAQVLRLNKYNNNWNNTMKSTDFIKQTVTEDATAGSSMTSTIAITPQTLGEKGTFSQKEVNKKLHGYTNQLTKGGIVKGVNASKGKK